MYISCIIPCFNSESTIERCLKSILNSTRVPDEIILIDDCSTDKTLSIIEKYPVTIFSNEVNQGPSFSRNKGFFKSSGDIILFIDSDVVVGRKSFEIAEAFFAQSQGHVAISGVFSFDHSCKGLISRYKSAYMADLHEVQEEGPSFLLGAFCGVERESFTLWDNNLRMAEDTVWAQSLMSSGISLRLLKSIKIKHLKRFSLLGLIEYDFKMAKAFVIPFLFHLKRKNTIAKFSHVKLRQQASLVFSFLSIIGILFITRDYRFVFFPLIIWTVLNFGHINRLNKIDPKMNRATLYLLVFLNSLVHVSGVFFGFSEALLKFWTVDEKSKS